MAIEIKWEKVATKDGPRFKVLRVKALTKNQLPLDYFEKEHVYGTSNCLVHVNSEHGAYKRYPLIITGLEYTKEEMDEKLRILYRCGDRLRKINEHIAKENKDWNGNFTFYV